ncbi:hypothetical protein CAPTEDRAFT_185281 [Capitella teleta]|uniref:Uncharacterized protein n=1 Tax=Capitella teleta TaxID=283909 RepID=R7T560_CAPTE|nr:hypothetical protein CAPTEDRAFT_185281 [Capitella teleta]|eukprot:ELT88337.1 hypothetical protein CAPTEDRAFT_185281 [Capitella teleta]
MPATPSNIRLTWREYLICALSWSPAGDLTNIYTITSPFPKLPQLSLLVNSTIDVSMFLQSSSSLHLLSRSRFATDQEPVKSRRESERRPTQEMTGDLKRAGRLAIRHSNSHRSNRNKNMERGGVLHLSTLKIMTLTGLDLCPESSRWTCRCPQHIQPRKEKIAKNTYPVILQSEVPRCTKARVKTLVDREWTLQSPFRPVI